MRKCHPGCWLIAVLSRVHCRTGLPIHEVRCITSQAPCKCVDNILITYDENKSKADIPTHSLNIYIYIYIYIWHKYNTTLAYEKWIMFFYLVNEKSFYLIYQKSLSHIIRTQKSLLQLVLLLIPNQATLYKKKTSSIPVPVMHSTQSTIKVKLRKKIIPHLTQITENNCFKKFWITQLLVIKYKSNIHKISQIKEYTKSYVSCWGMSYFELYGMLN